MGLKRTESNKRKREVLARFFGGETKKALALEYGIAESTVNRWRMEAGIYKNKHTIKIRPEMDDLGNPINSVSGYNKVECEGKELDYKDNLRWALEAAGEFIRTKSPIKSCPNNQAFYLYVQAIREPKDFLAKISAMEAKEKPEVVDDEWQKECTKTEEEITRFLEELKNG